MIRAIKGGTVVTSSEMYQADIAIEDGVIVKIAKDIDVGGSEALDARGAYVFPGAIDPFVSHAMTLDGIPTGMDFSELTQAAVLGGTTTVLDCAYQDRGISLKETLEAWHAKARGRALSDYAFHMVIGDPSERTLGEFRDIVENEGVSSFKVFLGFKDRWMLTDASFFRLLQKAREIPALVVVHPENGCVTRFLQDYAIRHDNVSFAHYAQTSPCILEGEAIHRAVAFASLANCPLYMSPTTSSEGLEAVLRARGRDQEVFAETLLPYLLFDRLPEQARTLPSPPIRGKEDRETLWSALKQGYLHTVGSGHVGLPSMHSEEYAREDFRDVPKGFQGVTERFGLLYTYGVEERRITLNRFVSLVSSEPAKIFGMFPRKGTIAVGSDADVVVWDPTEEREITAKGSMYTGYRIQGMPVAVLLRGEVVVRNGELQKGPGIGKFIFRAKHGMYL